MENEFKKVMSERSDKELVKIVTIERHKYKGEAIEAAEKEIEHRNINPDFFNQLKEQMVHRRNQKENIDSNIAPSGLRFLNFIIDTITWYILALTMIFTFGFFLPINSKMVNLVEFTFQVIIILGTFLMYYTIMEIKFQKTIGKFITKTKVVKTDGSKLSNQDVLIRTICRLIPFDRLSFLFTKQGFHDYLSNTKVVKE